MTLDKEQQRFRDLLGWFMSQDPWPLSNAAHDVVEEDLNAKAKILGYAGWIDAFHRLPPEPWSRGIELFAKERRRQVEEEGYTSEHDARYTNNELFDAARCYIWSAHRTIVLGAPPTYGELNAYWPWDPKFFKPTADPLGNIVKAGALFAAHIDSQETP